MEEDSISIYEIFQIFFKYKWQLLISNLVLALLSILIVRFITPIYQSGGSVLINISLNEGLQGNNQGSILVKTIDSYIKTDFIKNEMIKELNLDTDVTKFEKRYTVLTDIDNYIISISCSSKYKEDNKAIVNYMINQISLKKDYFEGLYYGNINVNSIDIIEYAFYDYKLESKRMLYFAVLTIVGGIILSAVTLAYSFLNNAFDTVGMLERFLKKNKIEDVLAYDEINIASVIRKIESYNNVIILSNKENKIAEILCNYYNFEKEDKHLKKANINITFEENLMIELLGKQDTFYIIIIDYKKINKVIAKELIWKAKISMNMFIV